MPGGEKITTTSVVPPLAFRRRFSMAGLRDSISDLLLAFITSVILTALNLGLGLIDKRVDFYPYDTIGYVVPGLEVYRHGGGTLLGVLAALPSSFTGFANFYYVLYALGYAIFGIGLWQPNLVLFWHTFLFVALVIWIARAAGAPSLRTHACAFAALLPALSYTLHDACLIAFTSTSIGELLWPQIYEERRWYGWAPYLGKPDFLAASALAWSVALITVSRDRAGPARFVIAGLMLSLAVLTKGHLFPLYLVCWGAALFLNGLLEIERGRYMRTSYWAIVPIVALIVPWILLGGLDSSLDYQIAAFIHPLRQTIDYERFGGGLEFFVRMAPMGIGVLPLILALSWAAVAFGTVRTLVQKRALLINSGIFAFSACLTATVALAHTVGKSITQLFPAFIFLFLAIQTFVFDCYARSKQRKLIALFGGALSVIGLGTLAIGSLWWLLLAWNDEHAQSALEADRQTVSEINDIIAQTTPRTVLVPLMGSGFPSVLDLFARVQYRDAYKAVAYATPYQWPDSAFSRNPDLATAVRREISRFDLIMIIRGGSKLHPGLGTYMERAYELMENVVDDPAAGYGLRYKRVLSQTTESNVYFFRDRHNMTIELYERKR
jgi:hypothetical protein